MSKFKVGDVVLVNKNIDKSASFFGDAEKMYFMRGFQYVVTESDDHVITINDFLFHADDLTLVSSDNESRAKYDKTAAKFSNQSFIQALIDGELIENPAIGGISNGRFIGYAVEFDTDDEYGNLIKSHTIIDKDGKSTANCKITYIYSDNFQIQFELQPKEIPKTKMHAIAYTTSPVEYNHPWHTTVLTDAELARYKSDYSRYVILETWFE